MFFFMKKIKDSLIFTKKCFLDFRVFGQIKMLKALITSLL